MFQLFADVLRTELKSHPITFLSVVFAWCAIGVIAGMLLRIVIEVGGLSGDFLTQRIEQTEEGILRTRERACSSESDEAKSLYDRRLAEMQRRYRTLTGDYMQVPACRGLL